MNPASSSPSNTMVDREKTKSEKPNKVTKYSVPFHRLLFSFSDTTDMVLMIVGAASAVASGVSLPLTAVLFGNMINSFGGTQDIHTVVHKVSSVYLDFVFLAVGSGVVSFLRVQIDFNNLTVSCWMTTGERKASRIRNRYLKAMLRQDIAFFDKGNDSEQVAGRMSGDSILIHDAMGEKVGNFINLVTTFVAGIIIAFVRGWLLALVMLSMTPLLVAAGAAMSTAIARMAARGQAAYTEAAVVVEQTIGSIRTVASFTGEEQSVKKYSKSLQSAYDSSVREGLVAGLGLGTMMLLMFCAYSVGVWYGSVLILSKGYTGARIISVIFAVLIGFSSLVQVSPCLAAFAAGQATAFQMFETINRKPDIDVYDIAGKKPDDIQGDIEFRDVYFSYPSRPDQQIFRGFSLLIESGMTMALVGESGSGKSTIISLIERFYDPQAGEVLIDDINLKEYQLRWIRGKIGLVSQEPFLFASSIRDNIAYGKDDATIEEIHLAADLSNVSNFIAKMPKGIDTVVGDHGTQLSGGQKQRVAIARAILKDPRILLLDEARSALDAESERTVQEALDRFMKNRTTIVVAHRLSTVRNATMISVIRRGAILEKGSHSQLLMNPNGAYCQLIRTQGMNQDLNHTSLENEGRLDTSVNMERSSSLLTCSYSISLGSTPMGLIRHESTMKTTNTSKVSLWLLAYQNKSELLGYVLGAIAAIVNGLLFPIFGMLLSNVINTFYQPIPKLKKDSKHWSFVFLIFGFISLLAVTAKTWFFALAGANLIRRIRLMTFEKVVSMEIGWFDDTENSSGLIGARLSADAATVRSLVGDALALAVQNAATLIAGLVIAFSTNWLLSLVILALVPLIGLNFWIQMKFMKVLAAEAKMLHEKASQVASDAVGNIRTVASFSAEDKVMELYKMTCEGPRRTGLRQGVIIGIGYGVSFFLLFCADAACFYAAARLLQEGKTTFKEVFRVFLALSMAVIGISLSNSLALESTKAKSAAASVFAILNRTSTINPSDHSGMTLGRLKGDIEFRNICFRYPTRPTVQIFQDFCLAIQFGKTVALVGESGSGKSTVISLLQRFYDPDSGHILLDGVEIQKLQVRWLRLQMGLVSQEPTLFNDTIGANIAYGKDGLVTDAEIIAAAELANAHKFISTLQQGYDTLVGERGIQLSGGQKQRVAIARAIVKDPKILLLDEATSALDAESEKLVHGALERVMVNWTTMVIAHRLSAIEGADLIVVIKNGVIIEKGEHRTLINIKDGAYASLVALHCRNSA